MLLLLRLLQRCFFVVVLLFITTTAERRGLRFLRTTQEEEVKPDADAATTIIQSEKTITIDDDDIPTLDEMKERMKPRDLKFYYDNETDTNKYYEKQFFHLHHMKTGGTSINHLIKCGLDRIKSGTKTKTKVDLPWYDVTQCNTGMYERCMSGDETCTDRATSATAMNYCSPLVAPNKFGWNTSDAVTMVRDPVDRIWSMYRFRTKYCYKCHSLTDVYDMIEANNTADIGGGICKPQLSNHQTLNLLSSSNDFKDYESDEDIINEAIHNLRTRFVVVGLTHKLPQTAKMIGHAFPWLAETISVSDDSDNDEDSDNDNKMTPCKLPHANASPSNNHCSHDGKSHMPIPEEPDDHIRSIIEKHNQLDLKLYEAAVQQFNLQMEALGWTEEDFITPSDDATDNKDSTTKTTETVEKVQEEADAAASTNKAAEVEATTSTTTNEEEEEKKRQQLYPLETPVYFDFEDDKYPGYYSGEITHYKMSHSTGVGIYTVTWDDEVDDTDRYSEDDKELKQMIQMAIECRSDINNYCGTQSYQVGTELYFQFSDSDDDSIKLWYHGNIVDYNGKGMYTLSWKKFDDIDEKYKYYYEGDDDLNLMVAQATQNNNHYDPTHPNDIAAEEMVEEEEAPTSWPTSIDYDEEEEEEDETK